MKVADLFCPLCITSTQPRMVERYGAYTLHHCPQCDVVFAHPMRNPGSEWYDQAESYNWVRAHPPTLAWYHQQFLADPSRYGTTLLDIGCGTGAFLNEARKAGYRVEGLDFVKTSIDIAAERFHLTDLHAMNIEAFRARFPEKRFDVITFFEVLEHQDDPNAFLDSVKQLLTAGGHIVLSVPNRLRFLSPFREHDYPPNHLTRWSVPSLEAFLQRRGYEVVRVRAKELDTSDVAATLMAFIRLPITSRLVSIAQRRHAPKLIGLSAQLFSLKTLLFQAVAMPLRPLLKQMKLQGTNIYCLARLP